MPSFNPFNPGSMNLSPLGLGMPAPPNTTRTTGPGPASANQTMAPTAMANPGATFNNPAQSTGWTGVSSNADPYGVGNVGYDISQVPLQASDMSGGLSRDELLRAGGYGNSTSFVQGALPTSLQSTGPSKYENQNAPDGSALGSDAAQIAAQTTNSQQNQSQYPAYGNQYGLGGAISPPPSGAAPNTAQSDYTGGQGVTVNVPDTSSRGFNPWSIQGESNARDTSQGVST